MFTGRLRPPLAAALAGVLGCGRSPEPPPDPPPGPTLVWSFEATAPGGFVAAPWVGPDAVFVAGCHPRGLRYAGAVYALDPATGRQRWAFDGDGRMLATASGPAAAGGRVFVGEGMHADFVCHLYAVDAVTGRRLWAFEAGDHVEAGPAVSGDTVYAAAGNDGVYALDAASGVVRWHFAADLHVDSTPCPTAGRVVVGSGPSRRFKALAVVALDAATGKPVWRVPTDLPAWGAPRAVGGTVVVGLGNGRLTEGAKPPETPAGGVLCLDVTDGRTVWQVRTPDAVFQQPTADGARIYFGCRDGHLYAVRAADGGEVYRVPVGGPVVAPPAVADGRVYVVTTVGMMRCLDADTGREVWAWDVAARTRSEPLVVAAVRAVGGRVYVAAELRTAARPVAAVLCLQP